MLRGASPPAPESVRTHAAGVREGRRQAEEEAKANGNGNGAAPDLDALTSADLRRMALAHLVGELTRGAPGSSVRASLDAVVELGGLPGEIASALPLEARAEAAGRLVPELPDGELASMIALMVRRRVEVVPPTASPSDMAARIEDEDALDALPLVGATASLAPVGGAGGDEGESVEVRPIQRQRQHGAPSGIDAMLAASIEAQPPPAPRRAHSVALRDARRGLV